MENGKEKLQQHGKNKKLLYKQTLLLWHIKFRMSPIEDMEAERKQDKKRKKRLVEN